MSEKRFVPSKYAGHTHDVKTDKHYYVTDEYVGCRKLFDEIENLEDENEQLKHWNKCLAEKRHNEKESNESLIKKLIGKIDFLERIIDGDV